jgi:hypothetical protein
MGKRAFESLFAVRVNMSDKAKTDTWIKGRPERYCKFCWYIQIWSHTAWQTHLNFNDEVRCNRIR